MMKKLTLLAFLGSMLCGGAQAMNPANDWIYCLPGDHHGKCKKDCKDKCKEGNLAFLQAEIGYGCHAPDSCWCLCNG